jgi:hypothetical protein
MVLVIIVAVAWMVILGPSLMRRRSRTVGEIGSISHFHQQLRVLEHSAPQPIVAPAYRLRTVDGGDDPRWGPDDSGTTRAPVLTVVGADQLPRPALAFLGQPGGAGQPPTTVGVPPGRIGRDPEADPGPEFDDLGPNDGVRMDGPLAGSTRPADPLARHRIRRRRRDTLGVLACLFVVTMMIGFVPGAGAVWLVTAASGVAMAAYVGLLVHLRRVAEEREQKLRYLRPETRGIDADGAPGARLAMSGRYAHPSNQAVLAR